MERPSASHSLQPPLCRQGGRTGRKDLKPLAQYRSWNAWVDYGHGYGRIVGQNDGAGQQMNLMMQIASPWRNTPHFHNMLFLLIIACKK